MSTFSTAGPAVMVSLVCAIKQPLPRLQNAAAFTTEVNSAIQLECLSPDDSTLRY